MNKINGNWNVLSIKFLRRLSQLLVEYERKVYHNRDISAGNPNYLLNILERNDISLSNTIDAEKLTQSDFEKVRKASIIGRR